MLARQGPDAPGGAYDYVVRGKMIGGWLILDSRVLNTPEMI
jgi:hypothetical protein